jgi:nucleoside-diphosphate-sugar epimerase
MLKVAVVGANGFIGSRVVEMFHLEQMAEVRPVVRRISAMARLSRFDLDCRIADGFDREALATAFDGCDIVLHAIAGDPDVILGTLSPVYTAAQQAGVRRIVYLSSACVHGQAPAAGTTEASPLSDRQSIQYNNAKVRAERLLLRLRAAGEVEVVLLRPGIVFGPRSSWISNFADALIAGEAYLIDRGQGICNSIYVDNLVHAIRLAMTAASADREAFLLGDGECVTWADLYRPIAAALGLSLEAVPDATRSMSLTPAFRVRFNAWRQAKITRVLSPILPVRFKRAVGAVCVAFSEQLAASQSPWETPSTPEVAVTVEMAQLYRCQTKLPFEKATGVLDYVPTVSFEEGCCRTVAWMEFAGYDIVSMQRLGVYYRDRAIAWE